MRESGPREDLSSLAIAPKTNACLVPKPGRCSAATLEGLSEDCGQQPARGGTAADSIHAPGWKRHPQEAARRWPLDGRSAGTPSGHSGRTTTGLGRRIRNIGGRRNRVGFDLALVRRPTHHFHLRHEGHVDAANERDVHPPERRFGSMEGRTLLMAAAELAMSSILPASSCRRAACCGPAQRRVKRAQAKLSAHHPTA